MKSKINLGGLICVILGVVILICAIAAQPPEISANSTTYPTSSQFQLSYRFGGDFYTEMFGVTYNTLAQLTDMSEDLASSFRYLENSIRADSQGIAKTVVWGVRWLMAAMGLLLFGLGAAKLIRKAPEQKPSDEILKVITDIRDSLAAGRAVENGVPDTETLDGQREACEPQLEDKPAINRDDADSDTRTADFLDAEDNGSDIDESDDTKTDAAMPEAEEEPAEEDSRVESDSIAP